MGVPVLTGYAYSGLRFTDSGEDDPMIIEILRVVAELHVDAGTVARWSCSPSRGLIGDRPVDILDEAQAILTTSPDDSEPTGERGRMANILAPMDSIAYLLSRGSPLNNLGGMCPASFDPAVDNVPGTDDADAEATDDDHDVERISTHFIR